jgi:dihydroxyacetone kinase-like predicted kinase
MAAEAAASAAAQEGIELHVVPSRSAVQGIAALAVFDPTEEAARNAAAMSAAAEATRHGAVTVATREAATSAGTCRPGDVLGIVGGEIVVVGSDLEEVAVEVMARLLSEGGELATVIAGEGAANGLAQALAQRLRRGHSDLEVTVIDGGQLHYPLLLGVE